MLRDRRVVLGWLMLLACPAFASEPVVWGESHQIASKHLNETRAISVAIPKSYQANPEGRYPVLYCLDGASHFKAFAGATTWLSGAGNAIPELIVVAIENAPGMRGADMGAAGGDSGRSEAFVKFIEEELVGHVDRTFPTQPFRILFGHSLAGRFAVKMMTRNPSTFQAYIVASPYFAVDKGASIDRMSEQLDATKDKYRFVFASLGEEQGLMPFFEKFQKTMADAAPETTDWTAEVLSGESHMTTPGPTLHQGLLKLFGDLQLAPGSETMQGGVASIKAYYRKLAKEKYGFELSAEAAINNYGLLTAQKGDLSSAIEILKANTAEHPKSWQAQLSLSRVLEASKQLEPSLAAAQKAHKFAAGEDPSVVKFLGQRVASLEKRLKSSGN